MPRLGAGAARSEEGEGEGGGVGGGALSPGNLTASLSGTAETRARQHRAATSGAPIMSNAAEAVTSNAEYCC